MRRFIHLALLFVAPAFSFAQSTPEPNAPSPPADGTTAQAQPPSEPQPSETPPPPPQPGAPAAPAEVSPQPVAVPSGQWVYTNQYGWLWIPYAQPYTYIPDDPQFFPYQYVYYPVYGWRWVVAPWVFGYGPAPYWGAPGVRFFVWYTHPWFRAGGYWGWGGYRGWGRYYGWIGPRSWGPHGWARAPAYFRAGVGRRYLPPMAHYQSHPR